MGGFLFIAAAVALSTSAVFYFISSYFILFFILFNFTGRARLQDSERPAAGVA